MKIRDLMYDVRGKEWVQDFWNKEFLADEQARVLENFLNKFELDYGVIHKEYIQEVDTAEQTVIPVLVILGFAKDAIALISEDLIVGLYSNSHDRAFHIGVNDDIIDMFDFEYSDFNPRQDKKQGVITGESITMYEKRYDILKMSNREITKDAVKRAMKTKFNEIKES